MVGDGVKPQGASEKAPNNDKAAAQSVGDDNVASDTVGGDKIAGDQFIVHHLRDVKGMAIGAGAQAIVNEIVNNITNITQQALSTADEAERARVNALRILAENVRDYAQRFHALASQKQAASTGGPYRGLVAYTLADAALFFGRERAIVELLETMQRSRLTILQAESGAGKSSLLQAGIAPQLLLNGYLPLILRPYDLAPGVKIKQTFLTGIDLAHDLAQAPLRDFLQQINRVLGTSTNLMIVLDQFEEFFTLLRGEEQQTTDQMRTTFVNELADCLEDASLNVRWVLALRSEFFGDLASFRPRIRNPFENDYRLNRLTLTEARAVITQPAAQSGIDYEPALVDAILSDLQQEDGEVAPPQIQLVCDALYQAFKDAQAMSDKPSHTIAAALYEAEGRAKGILGRYLNRVLTRTLRNKEEQELARRLLLELVSSNQRRLRLTHSELAKRLATGLIAINTLDGVLKELVDTHLVIAEQDDEDPEATYELAHDYLLGEIQVDPTVQAQKAARELLQQEVIAYQRFGTPLEKKKFDVINSQRSFLNLEGDAQAKDLLDRSEEAIQAAEREKEEQQQQKLKAAQDLADEQRRRSQQFRIAAIVAGVLTVLAVILGIRSEISANREGEARQTAVFADVTKSVALSTTIASQETAVVALVTAQAAITEAVTAKGVAEVERDKADHEAKIARSRQLAAQSISQLNIQFDLALLLSIEAYNTEQTFEAYSGLLSTNLNNPRLLSYLRSHTDDVTDVAYNLDGKLLASAGADGKIILWDTQNFKPIGQPLMGHKGSVSSIAFSPITNLLVSGGNDDHLVILWDINLYQPIHVLEQHKDEIFTVAFSRDGKTIASAGRDENIYLWDVSTYELKGQLPGGDVWSLDFAPDGNRIAIGQGSPSIWDFRTQQPIFASMQGEGHRAFGVAFSPNGKILASADRGFLVEIWNTETGLPIFGPLKGHTSMVGSVAFSPHGTILASGSSDNTTILWDTTNYRPIGAPLRGHLEGVSDIAFSPDGSQLASSSFDNTIILWDMKQPSRLAKALNRKVREDNNKVTFDSKGYLQSFVATGNGILVEPLESNEMSYTVALTPSMFLISQDGQTLVVQDSTNSEVHLFNTLTRKSHIIMTTMPENSKVGITLDSQTLFINLPSNELTLWDVRTGQILSGFPKQLPIDKKLVSISPDRKTVALVDGNASIHLFDIQTAKQLGKPFKTYSVEDLAFSPDGHYVGAIVILDRPNSIFNTAILLNAANGQLIGQPFNGLQAARLSGISFSPNSQQAVIFGESGKGFVVLWDIKQQQRIGEPLHSDGEGTWINQAAFSPDGRRLVSVDFQDGAVVAWSVNPDSWHESACKVVNRNLSNIEWNQYLGSEIPYHTTCVNH